MSDAAKGLEPLTAVVHSIAEARYADVVAIVGVRGSRGRMNVGAQEVA